MQDRIEPDCFTDHEQCLVPPLGWHCIREAGHDGPCAASPTQWEPGDVPILVLTEVPPFSSRLFDMGIGAAIAVVIGFLMLMIYG